MVKSIINTSIAILLCLAFFIFVDVYIKGQFKEFEDAVHSLYEKVETQTANREDAYAVKNMWQNKKSTLHIFIPHNDISYVDYWLNEACGLIYNGLYDLALGKIEVLENIARTLPESYTLQIGNVF